VKAVASRVRERVIAKDESPRSYRGPSNLYRGFKLELSSPYFEDGSGVARRVGSQPGGLTVTPLDLAAVEVSVQLF
jgi:hypothetical protein